MSELRINETYGVIVVKDLEAVYVDDNYARIYGYSSATELMTNISSFFELIEPDEHQFIRDNYRLQIIGKQTPRGRTYKNRDRYGRSLTVFTIDHLIEWEGEPALQVTVVDMTMTERMQTRLEQNEQQFRKLITSSGQGITIHRHFKPLLVNQAWVELTHAPSIEYVLQNVSLLDLIPKGEQEEAKQRYVDIIDEKLEGAHILVENVCFDGKKRYFNVYDNKIEWDGEPAMQAVIEDVTERVLMEKELKRLAITDSLTQLCNRHRLNVLLAEEQSRFSRYGTAFSLIMIDLDLFKSINDNWGHDSGDKALVSVSQELKRITRKVDEVGRWGGEEFMVICPETELLDAYQLAEKLRGAIEGLKIDERFSVTASLGVVTIKKGEFIRQLIIRVDKALYEAKDKGRNRVVALD